MALYTFGGSPADVLTTANGDVVPDYPVLVRVAGTGQLVTALYEADGTTPIGELRSNPSTSPQPGAIRAFKTDVSAIEFEYNDATGQAIRWFENGRELAAEALATAQGALSRSAGGTVTGPVTAADGLTVNDGFTVNGDGHVDNLDADTLTVGGKPVTGGSGATLPGLFSPQAYGAMGDGVADDAPAVQAALDAAYNGGGGWVLVPPGTYRCATLPLRIRRGTRLTLMQGATFQRGAPNTFLLNGDAAQTFGGYTGHGDLVIEGGVWDMRATDNPTNPDMCISIGHARNVVIRDLEIRDVGGYHAIELNSTKNGAVTGCSFRGYLDTGGRDFSEAVQLDGAFRVSVFGGFGPYDGTPCEDVVMRDCYVGASGTAGTVAWPAGVGSHSAAWGVWHRRIKIMGNSFEGGAQYAVKPYIWDESVISGNTVVNMGAGVWARTLDSTKTADRKDMSGVDRNASQPGTSLVIEGNVFRGGGSFNEPIYVQGDANKPGTGPWRDLTITGNTINGATGGQNGIRIEQTDRYVVHGNTITGVEGTGVSQESVSDAVISGNRVSNAGGSGISCVTGKDVLVDGNRVQDVKTNGIHVQAGSYVRLNGNHIKAAGTGGSGYGIRITTGSDSITITNNTYRKLAGAPANALNALSITSNQTNFRRFGNDVKNQGPKGDGTDDIADASTTPNLSPYDTGA